MSAIYFCIHVPSSPRPLQRVHRNADEDATWRLTGGHGHSYFCVHIACIAQTSLTTSRFNPFHTSVRVYWIPWNVLEYWYQVWAVAT
jgi:hypothetical protein